MNDLILYPHLGLGDLIICNGLIRELCFATPNIKFTLVTKPSGYLTTKFMFKDVPNLTVHKLSSGGFDSPESHQEVVTLAMTTTQRIMYIGHGQEPTRFNFDRAFYEQFEIDFKKRWDSFKVERDLTSEKNLVEKLNIKEKYIFVHDDPARGMCMSRSIPAHIRVIKASTDISNNMFDYLSLIEGAMEVHCIESSFMFLIDSFSINVPLFAHRYARNYPMRNTPTLKLDWNILT